MTKDSAVRFAKAEKRLSEIEKLVRGHSPDPKGRDYISRGDWFPADSGKLKERGNDHPRAGLRHAEK